MFEKIDYKTIIKHIILANETEKLLLIDLFHPRMYESLPQYHMILSEYSDIFLFIFPFIITNNASNIFNFWGEMFIHV